ncbi:MAG TPA: hypothetical protein VEL76_16245 [Gemmataceae bacterium]|nr:hypothetical protein [Gemmataceae bacterium]
MQEVITCPNCDRKLQVAPNLLGQDVQCPTCGATFIATLGDQPLPSARRAPPERPSRRPPDYDDDYDPPPRRRYRRDDYYDRPPAPTGPGMALGISSMVMGIVAIPFAVFPCLGFFVLPLAGLALLLGVLGLVLGSRERDGNTGFAVAGISTSAAAILLVLMWLLAFPHAWDRGRWWGWWW